MTTNLVPGSPDGGSLETNFLRIATDNVWVMPSQGLRVDMEIIRRPATKRVVFLLGPSFSRNPCSLKDTLRLLCRNMSMKAVVVEEFGDSSKLKFCDVTKPVPAEGEV